MHVTNEKTLPQAKSYTSIYEIFGSSPFNNVLYKNLKKCNDNVPIFKATCGDTGIKQSNNPSEILNQTSYITYEKYHVLNKNSSHKSIIRCTSTLFYNLDDIAKRHSFYYISELGSSNANMLLNTNRFKKKSNTIVQECTIQMHPNMAPKDSREIISKKIKKCFPDDDEISSEILLKDDYVDTKIKNHYYDRDINDRHQKFWSYAKYRTEYTNPVSEEKKRKKKDRGKHTEDPCPCQLFSYACPCSDKKSLTELAQNSKSLTVAHEITSTAKNLCEAPRESKVTKTKGNKTESVRKDKPTNTSVSEFNNYDIIFSRNDPNVKVSKQHDSSNLVHNRQMNENGSINSKIKCTKKYRKVVCPNCKEKVEIMSTTEEEESLKYNNFSAYKIPSKSYSHRSSPRQNKTINDNDICNHQPRCELVPVCQILPTDNIYVNHSIKKTTPKSKPRVISITKACRHHPPCTVVPSCQKVKVLKNNCEYIPPCLHRPRCVNVPLCVSFSKNLYYHETANLANDAENNICPYIPRCKYIPECQKGISSNIENSTHMVSRVQNACEFLNDFHSSPYSIHSKSRCLVNSFSPYQIQSLNRYNCCKSNKSCQYDCLDCKCNVTNIIKEYVSSDTVIFIRDVGCQFRNKKRTSKNSTLQSKHSITSFDSADNKKGGYYTNVHTLIYEDKFTNPILGTKASASTLSVTSFEMDKHCLKQKTMITSNTRGQTTGFVPKPVTSPYIGAVTTYTGTVASRISIQNNMEVKNQDVYFKCDQNNTFPVTSHRSLLKGKYKKMFSVKRKRRSRVSSLNFIGRSKYAHY